MSRTPPGRPYPRTISSPDCADPTVRPRPGKGHRPHGAIERVTHPEACPRGVPLRQPATTWQPCRWAGCWPGAFTENGRATDQPAVYAGHRVGGLNARLVDLVFEPLSFGLQPRPLLRVGGSISCLIQVMGLAAHDLDAVAGVVRTAHSRSSWGACTAIRISRATLRRSRTLRVTGSPHRHHPIPDAEPLTGAAFVWGPRRPHRSDPRHDPLGHWLRPWWRSPPLPATASSPVAVRAPLWLRAPDRGAWKRMGVAVAHDAVGSWTRGCGSSMEEKASTSTRPEWACAEEGALQDGCP